MADVESLFLNLKEDEFKKYFLQDDSLRVLDNELSITLNKRYKCNAGCQMCYLSDQWIGHTDFKPIGLYTEQNLTAEWEETFFAFADNFEVVSTIDDMKYLKKYFSKQYNFYKNNAEYFSLSSISDQSLFYHFPIITGEMKFKDIYEITFSDRFLLKNLKKIKGMLSILSKRYNIQQVKIILGSQEQNRIERQKTKDFIKFTLDKNIAVYNHHNINEEWFQVQDPAHTFYSQDNKPYSILNQVTFLAFEDIYLELKNFTSKDEAFKAACIYSLHDFTDLIPKILNTKLNIYRNNATTLLNKDNNYTKYFKYCADTFKINDDFNFIPYILLRDYAKWYKNILKDGQWHNVGPGLLKRDSIGIKSVIEVIK